MKTLLHNQFCKYVFGGSYFLINTDLYQADEISIWIYDKKYNLWFLELCTFSDELKNDFDYRNYKLLEIVDRSYLEKAWKEIEGK